MAAVCVIGVGTDLVDIDRFRKVMDRTPGLKSRVFTPGEQAYADRAADPTPRYAARFAAKEATMKALGVGLGGVRMTHIEVHLLESGAPQLVLREGAADLATSLGVSSWRLSLTHSETAAHAIVIAL